jgi:hypothetical protein
MFRCRRGTRLVPSCHITSARQVSQSEPRPLKGLTISAAGVPHVPNAVDPHLTAVQSPRTPIA